jgi:hypothetical protein
VAWLADWAAVDQVQQGSNDIVEVDMRAYTSGHSEIESCILARLFMSATQSMAQIPNVTAYIER